MADQTYVGATRRRFARRIFSFRGTSTRVPLHPEEFILGELQALPLRLVIVSNVIVSVDRLQASAAANARHARHRHPETPKTPVWIPFLTSLLNYPVPRWGQSSHARLKNANYTV